MRGKTLLTVVAFFVGLFAVVVPAISQQAPPESEKARQIVALFDRAAALLDSKGKSILPEFRKPDSEWRSGDFYLFITDLKGLELFNAAFPKFEGTDVSGLKDANGKLLQIEFVKTVQSKGSGWVDYMWPKPGQSQPSHKWGYVKAVTVDGDQAFVGAGFYPE